ncbi:hypothetical protein SLEP1_g22190 [Rubroshorea leprosula]|uniref:Uncharacterized protein n=1 Tax=Rubroshorea leprosula TaxID=152421 RepID=A0AAV5JKF8_9ROSI|nr:hypothetical protein SLEP1_g22190 [Rubroshorea leprosula]
MTRSGIHMFAMFNVVKIEHGQGEGVDKGQGQGMVGDARRQSSASNRGLGPIPVPSDDKAPFESKEAKEVEALVMNVKQALAKLEVCHNISTGEVRRGVRVSHGTPSITKKSEVTRTWSKKIMIKPHMASESPHFKAVDVGLAPRKPLTKKSVDTTTIEKDVEKDKAKAITIANEGKDKEIVEEARSGSNQGSDN